MFKDETGLFKPDSITDKVDPVEFFINNIDRLDVLLSGVGAVLPAMLRITDIEQYLMIKDSNEDFIGTADTYLMHNFDSVDDIVSGTATVDEATKRLVFVGDQTATLPTFHFEEDFKKMVAQIYVDEFHKVTVTADVTDNVIVPIKSPRALSGTVTLIINGKAVTGTIS